VIGWLLTTCTNQVAASNAKLALFYDWLFYDQEKDNIMNIEPAILVMHHSMRPHPAITATLLDFLCRIIHNFCPAEAEKVRNGIYSSLRQIVDKRVQPSLSPLFDSQRLDRELRTMLKERFGVFLSKEEGGDKGDPGPIIDKDDHYGPSEPGPVFSDDEDSQDSLPGGYDRKEEVKEEEQQQPARSLSPPGEQEEEEEVVEVKPEVKVEPANHARRNSNNHATSNGERDMELEQEVVDKLEELSGEKNCERRCEIMDQLVQVMISEQVEDENARQVAEKLSDILKDQFEGRIFPETPTPESIEDSIGQPLFVMFRSLCEISEIDPARTPLLTVLAELYGLQPRLGYYLLYYLKSYKMLDSKSRSNVYKDLMLAIDDNNSLDICPVNDKPQCQEDDVTLFVWLCPDIYTHFQKAAIGNVDLLYLVVSCVDGRQIQTLICHIIARDFIMFKKDSFQPVISASLTWETFEQFALWQLLSGHDLPVDCLLPLLPKLSYDSHAEALTHIMILLKREKPTAELVKHLMSREPRHKDRFVTSILTCWINDYEDKLGDLLGSQLCKQASPAGGKRKRTQGPSTKNSLGTLAEMTLNHLDNLRQTCRQYDLFNLHSIQQALNTVRSLCTDGQKKKFMDLFALADSESEDEALQKPKPLNKSKPRESQNAALRTSHRLSMCQVVFT
jgi:integrator complex subunit 3